MPIQPYLEDHSAFDPHAIRTMSEALERACHALNVNGHLDERQAIAARIVDLARAGIIDANALSERVIKEITALRSL